jgi:hypothetical protein
MNALGLEYSAEMLDNTVFGNTTRLNKGGLKVVAAAHEGLWSGGVGNVDEVLWNDIAVANIPMSIGPEIGADGEVGYTFLANVAEYSPGAAIGEIFKFRVRAQATGDLIRGTIMHNAARTASGNGTARQLGAITSIQKMYAALHVTAASVADTLDVKIQSDDAVGMGSPTDRITFAQKTAIGYEWKQLSGPITDDWWRVNYTIGGVAPSFTFILVIGIK